MKTIILAISLLALSAQPPKKTAPTQRVDKAPANKVAPKSLQNRSPAIKSPKTTTPKKSKVERPTQCAAITDQTDTILKKAVDVLATESRRKGAKSPLQGQKALIRYIATIKDKLKGLRAQAKALKLDDATFRACEDDANKVFLKTLARLSTIRNFYKSEPESFRLIGDLFK